MFSTHSDVGSSGHSASDADLLSTDQKKEATDAITRWNPFEDTTPFNQVVTEEEDLFGKEFDKIREEGKKTFFHIFKNLFSYFLYKGTKSAASEHPAVQEDPFQAPFSLRQQRALRKNGSIEVEGKVCN